MATAPPAAQQTRRARAAALAGRIYTEHHAPLLAIARRNSACPEDAEEALQDAFILFIDHFDPEGEAPPLAWLKLTLKRRCWALCRYQRLRSAKRRMANVEKHGDKRRSPEEVIESADNLAGARHRLAALKPDERNALGLFAFGYSYLEICDLTGWTYTKVNRCITEGRACLRDSRG